VRSTIEHLIESGIVERELADAWKKRMAEKKRSEEMVKKTKEVLRMEIQTQCSS